MSSIPMAHEHASSQRYLSFQVLKLYRLFPEASFTAGDARFVDSLADYESSLPRKRAPRRRATAQRDLAVLLTTPTTRFEFDRRANGHWRRCGVMSAQCLPCALMRRCGTSGDSCGLSGHVSFFVLHAMDLDIEKGKRVCSVRSNSHY